METKIVKHQMEIVTSKGTFILIQMQRDEPTSQINNAIGKAGDLNQEEWKNIVGTTSSKSSHKYENCTPKGIAYVLFREAGWNELFAETLIIKKIVK